LARGEQKDSEIITASDGTRKIAWRVTKWKLS